MLTLSERRVGVGCVDRQVRPLPPTGEVPPAQRRSSFPGCLSGSPYWSLSDPSAVSLRRSLQGRGLVGHCTLQAGASSFHFVCTWLYPQGTTAAMSRITTPLATVSSYG